MSLRNKPLLFLSLALLIQSPGALAFKCWTNRDGIRECGDAVPPEYAQKESRTYNERGMTVDVQKRAKSKEELEEEERRKEEEERRLAAEKRQREKQQAADRVLLMTYSSERDITASRDRKLSAIQGTIDITHTTITALEKRLDNKKRQAARSERGGKAVPEEVTEAIASIKKQIADKHAYIERKKQDMADIKEKSDAELKRYREITANSR